MFRSILHKSVFACVMLLLAYIPAISHQQKMTNTVSRKAAAANKSKQAFARYMTAYISDNRELFEKIKLRNASSFKMMDAMFKKYGLPSDLKYLAVVESEMKTSAVSRVGAVGPWQLMAGTAQDLGLKVSAKNDERKQFYKSTRAAALYLRDLHNEFGDWLLVLAAYNSGPGPVHKAIRRAGSRDFWQLQAYLPAETRAHVKRIIATRYYFEGQGTVSTEFMCAL